MFLLTSMFFDNKIGVLILAACVINPADNFWVMNFHFHEHFGTRPNFPFALFDFVRIVVVLSELL